MQTFTTSTASSVGDLSGAAAQEVTLTPGTDGPSSSSNIPAQQAAVFCTLSGAAATATISLILVETGNTGYERIARFKAEIAATAFRTPTAGGASGNYIASTVFESTGTHKVDLLGYGQAVSSRNTKTKWYVVVEVLSAGSITINIADTRAI